MAREYQYKTATILVTPGRPSLEEQLTQLGKQGWRTVTVLDVTPPQTLYKVLLEMAAVVDRETGEWEYL